MSKKDDDREESRELLVGGLELGSSVAGATAGVLIGGVPGALAGATITPVMTRGLRWAVKELIQRRLSDRESARSVTALDFAVAEITRRMQAGEKPREDGFFASEGDDRPAAEELLEGTLLAAQRSHEEKKVPFLGRLYASVAFDAALSPPVANYLVKLLGDLSYSQLVALAVFTMNTSPEGFLRLSDRLLPDSQQSFRQQQLAHEILDLFNRALVTQLGSKPGTPNEIMLGPALISPARTRPQGMGMKLAVAARLTGAQGEDLASMARELGSPLERGAFG